MLLFQLLKVVAVLATTVVAQQYAIASPRPGDKLFIGRTLTVQIQQFVRVPS